MAPSWSTEKAPSPKAASGHVRRVVVAPPQVVLTPPQVVVTLPRSPKNLNVFTVTTLFCALRMGRMGQGLRVIHLVRSTYCGLNVATLATYGHVDHTKWTALS